MKSPRSLLVLALTTGTALPGCFGAGEGPEPGSSPADGEAGEGAPPVVAWHVGQGTDGEEHVHEGIQTRDGGYVAIGQTDEPGGGAGTDLLVVKVDAEGELEWRRVLGSENTYEVGIAVLEADEGLWIGGGLERDGRQQSVVVKLDDDGEVLWATHLHTDRSSAVRGLARAPGGGVVATGYRGGTEDGFVFISEESTGFLAQLDEQGDVVWDADLPVPQGTKVRAHPDGGYAVLSTDWVVAGGEDVQNAVLVRTNDRGQVEWTQAYGGTNNNQAFDFDLTPSGGFVLAGHTTGFGATNWDCLMMSVDPEGALLWHARLGQPRGYDARYIHDECYGIRVDADGGYVMAGGTGDEYDYSAQGHPSGPSDEWKAYAMRLLPDGTLDWAQVYGDGPDEGNNAAEFLALTADGGILLFNDTDSRSEPEPNNFGFMKLEPAAR